MKNNYETSEYETSEYETSEQKKDIKILNQILSESENEKEEVVDKEFSAQDAQNDLDIKYDYTCHGGDWLLE